MKIEHIAMYVHDLEKARDFFVKYFGAVSNDIYCNPNTHFNSYFLRFENGARLEIMNKPDIIDNANNINKLGYSHIAFSTGSKEEVDLLTERLKNDGYQIVSGPRLTGDGYYESCVIAFEGNLIEITV